jgi:hypothetical protein
MQEGAALGRRLMDPAAWLIEAFGSRGKRDHSAWKLDVLMDLGRHDDPKVIAFFLAVVVDAEEPTDVRLDALGRLREVALDAAARCLAADASLKVLSRPSDDGLRLHAALVLGDFTDVPGVLDALGALTQEPDESIELRYNAFTSLQRAGPTEPCLDVLRALSADETLGPSARAILASWGVH